MNLVSTKIDVCAGHDACPPRSLASYSPDVTAEGIEIARQDDNLVGHGCSVHPPHGATVSYGWQSVTVNNRPIAHVGASVSCPSGVLSTGRRSVTVGQ